MRMFIVASCLLVVLAVSLAVSWRYSARYGGTDLRCRIVSARLQGTRFSPLLQYGFLPGCFVLV